jgi:hypothetical protein
LNIATVVCTALVGGGLWQFVLLCVELRSLVQGGQGISKILRRGIDFIQLLFSEHSMFYFFIFTFPECFLSVDAQFFLQRHTDYFNSVTSLSSTGYVSNLAWKYHQWYAVHKAVR